MHAREYDAFLAQAARVYPSAQRLGVKTCLKCGLCCLRFCTPRPEELAPIAAYLKLSVDELISKYMVIDTADCKTFFLRWAKHGQENITGRRIHPLRTYDRGPCIFFDTQKHTCLIHSVRPVEARHVKCWVYNNGTDQGFWGIKSWTSDDIYKYVPDFDPGKNPDLA
ncbi:MAG: YkgJ family cysteine cluster protein [Dehalogenimonas sp.]